MKPMEVVVRAPKRNFEDWLVQFLASWVVVFGFAGLMVWLVPIAFHVEVGYWQSFAILVVVRLVMPIRTLPYLLPSDENRYIKASEGK